MLGRPMRVSFDEQKCKAILLCLTASDGESLFPQKQRKSSAFRLGEDDTHGKVRPLFRRVKTTISLRNGETVDIILVFYSSLEIENVNYFAFFTWVDAALNQEL